MLQLMDRVIASVATCCVLLVLLVHSGEATGLKDLAWEKPGCHKVGKCKSVTQKLKIGLCATRRE